MRPVARAFTRSLIFRQFWANVKSFFSAPVNANGNPGSVFPTPVSTFRYRWAGCWLTTITPHRCPKPAVSVVVPMVVSLGPPIIPTTVLPLRTLLMYPSLWLILVEPRSGQEAKAFDPAQVSTFPQTFARVVIIKVGDTCVSLC